MVVLPCNFGMLLGCGCYEFGCLGRVGGDARFAVFCGLRRPHEVPGHGTGLSGRVLPEVVAGCVAVSAGAVVAAVAVGCVFGSLL